MAKRFKLKFSRVLPSFHTCRSDDDSVHLPATFCLSTVNPKALDVDVPPPPLPPPPLQRISPTRPLLPETRRAAPHVVSLGCGCRPAAPRRNPFVAIDADADPSRARETPAYLWRKEEKWHVVTSAADAGGGCPPSPRRKIDSDDGSDVFPPSLERMLVLARSRRRHKGFRSGPDSKSRSRSRNSGSSGDSGWFSSDEEEYYRDESKESAITIGIDGDDDGDDETETLVSSCYTDSSDAFFVSREIGGLTAAGAETATATPVTTDGNRVKESFAVVKRSEDPRGDFKNSMAEMIVEKQIYEPEDLEQLLRCFLSLNARHHHATIVAAFSEIWDALFQPPPATSSS